jgi:hypothetical protein
MREIPTKHEPQQDPPLPVQPPSTLGMREAPTKHQPQQVPSSPVQLPRTSASTGRKLKFTAVGIVVALFVVPLFLHFSGAWLYLSMFISILITVGVIQMFLRARKFTVASAEEVLSADPRPPVIYMRSFKDDAAASMPVMSGPPGWALLFPKELITEEELVARTLNDFGPMVTIGRPGEQLRELGAARMYVGEQEWHEKVAALMQSAKLVVLRLGQTEGLWWELEQAIGKMRPEQLLVFVPRIADKATREAIRRHAEAVFPKPLPEFAHSNSPWGNVGSLRGILCFDPDWTAHYIDLTRRIFTLKTLPRFLGFGKPSAKLKYALQPVFANHGVAWTPPPVRKLATTLVAIWCVAALAIVGVILFAVIFN